MEWNQPPDSQGRGERECRTVVKTQTDRHEFEPCLCILLSR